MSRSRHEVWLLVALAVSAACSRDDSDQRVAELERKVARQEAKQRQLEERLAVTLDAMSLRLDRIGVALAAAAGEPAPASTPATPAPARRASEVPPLARGPVAPGASGAAADERVVGAPPNPAVELDMHRRTANWIAGCVAVVAFVAVAMRLRSRARSLGDRSGRDEEAADFGSWEEAKVLTDAVAERAPTAASRDGSTEPVAVGNPARIGDFALDEEVLILDPADSEDEPQEAPPVVVAGATTQHGPTRTAFHVDACDPVLARSAVEAYLRHDPRVLQKPAPAVRVSEGGLSVECALLPGLPAGEREHLRAVLARLSSNR